jgi:broad specificity phosphatase PhoE
MEIRTDLRERSFGQWEGLSFVEVGAKMSEEAALSGVSAQSIRPPGGESFEDVWNRLDTVVDEIARTEDTITIVSHGGTLSLLLARLVKGTLDSSKAFRFANTGITELERRSDGLFVMTRYSDTSHLASEHVLSGSLDGVSR